MTDPTPFRCFACGLPLRAAVAGPDVNSPADNGTHWTTRGNFGSTVYDQCEGFNPTPGLLEIVICDHCVLERRDRVREHKAGKVGPPDFAGLAGPGPRPAG